MKPALISTFDRRGGAALATYRLHKALRKSGADSRLFVASKDARDPTVVGRDTWVGEGQTKLRTTLDNLPLRRYPNRRALFSPAWVPDRLRASIRDFRPDLLHLFWITGGMVRLETLGRVGRPIIWTLHDMWPFTGGCHYDDECGKYAVACGACPVLQSSQEEDLSRSVFRRKTAAWADSSITVVATSKWLRECAASSALFGRRRIEILPNCVDTHTYQPLDKAVVRRLFGLDEHAKTILFSGGSAHKDPRKGLRYLFDALAMLGRDSTSRLEAQVMLLGIPDDAVLPDCPFPIKRLAHLQDELSQAALYNTADVLVAPSVQENLSNVVVESVCCGTPVVAFDIGGMPDIITPGQTGYLAKPFSAESLAKGINSILKNDAEAASELSQRCRQLAVSRYSEDVVARQYLDLYADVIGSPGATQQRVQA